MFLLATNSGATKILYLSDAKVRGVVFTTPIDLQAYQRRLINYLATVNMPDR
jgi:hypothetical protein